jgi:3-dehydroquinate dehydratase / shikimate dehydrogenase
MIKRTQAKIEETGWGLWAVSVPGVANFIGYIGIAEPSFNPLPIPAIEIGWRLAYPFWGVLGTLCLIFLYKKGLRIVNVEGG